MGSIRKALVEAMARMRLKAKSCDLDISKSARVSYAGIHRRPPAVLKIGDGTIFTGAISSDRDGSVVLVGKNTFVGASHLVCAERIEIGDDVLISWGVTIADHDSHALDWPQRSADVRETFHGRKDWSNVRIAPVRINDRAWIGFGAIILRGVTIGEGAVVGAGSVVTKDVEPYTAVGGNPARLIRKLTSYAAATLSAGDAG